MTDILQRLRCTVPCQDMTAKTGCHCAEAADTIAALTARVEELEKALRPLACTCEAESQDECSRSEKHCPFWNARAALEGRT